jgi:pimeloyl-ACP methyl ester carboxylesterase
LPQADESDMKVAALPGPVVLVPRRPFNELVIYPDAGHAGIFQFHEQFVEKALEFLAC